MPNPRIPPSVTGDVQKALLELWLEIDKILGSRNVDWHGRRIINAGNAVDPQDYVTLGQLAGEVTTISKKVVQDLRPIVNVTGGGASGGGSGSSGGGLGDYYDSPLTDGDTIEPSLIFDSNGDCIIVQVPFP